MDRNYQFIYTLILTLFITIIILALENVNDIGTYLSVFAFEYLVIDEMFKVRKITFDFLKLSLLIIFLYIVIERILEAILL